MKGGRYASPSNPMGIFLISPNGLQFFFNETCTSYHNFLIYNLLLPRFIKWKLKTLPIDMVWRLNLHWRWPVVIWPLEFPWKMFLVCRLHFATKAITSSMVSFYHQFSLIHVSASTVHGNCGFSGGIPNKIPLKTRKSSLCMNNCINLRHIQFWY